MTNSSYYKDRLPDLIDRLKSQVEKNMRIITVKIETDLEEEKYASVLKARRMAIESCVKTMSRIDELEKEIKESDHQGYYRSTLPVLIDKIKIFVDLNMAIVDVDFEDEYPVELWEAQVMYEGKFEKNVPNKYKDNLEWLCKKLDIETKLSEDKFHHIIKARDLAGADVEWALKKIDELEVELIGDDNGQTLDIRKSWAKVAAEQKRVV